ncbi:MAG: hypothetical protein JO112_16910 [Planctomycetes bacterium]|nr:hypothetical protein [Planctomycetota bacterium]
MSRKSLLLILALLGSLGGLGTGLLVLVLHEPDSYLRRAVPPSLERKKMSGVFFSDFSNFFTRTHESEEQPWSVRFKEDCINSYFEEGFIQQGFARSYLPEGISQPRVAIDADKIRLMFRYSIGPWSTVVSIDVSVWVVPREANVIALEFQGLHAGLLPISAQSLLEHVTQMAQPARIEVTWYRHNRNPVALLRFQAEHNRPTIQLQKLDLQPGCLTVTCLSSDPATLGAMLFPYATLEQVAN